MIRRFALTAAMLIALGAMTAPTLAAPFCSGSSGIRFSITLGKKLTEREEAEFAMIQLRRTGVDATRVEFWNGCLRAFVRQPGGGEAMEFYDPETLERVY